MDYPDPLDWQTFSTSAEIEVTKRCRRRQSVLARVMREEACRAVRGVIGDPNGSRKEFLQTSTGLYRVSASGNSDNSTELVAHERMGATSLNFSLREVRWVFWAEHDLRPDWADPHFVERVRLLMRHEDDDG